MRHIWRPDRSPWIQSRFLLWRARRRI